jgi:hypothetical protein
MSLPEVDFIISLLSAKARRLTNDLSFEMRPTSIIGALVLYFLHFLPYFRSLGTLSYRIELKRRFILSFKITNIMFYCTPLPHLITVSEDHDKVDNEIFL